MVNKHPIAPIEMSPVSSFIDVQRQAGGGHWMSVILAPRFISHMVFDLFLFASIYLVPIFTVIYDVHKVRLFTLLPHFSVAVADMQVPLTTPWNLDAWITVKSVLSSTIRKAI